MGRSNAGREARREARDEKIGAAEDQALTAQTKKRKEMKSSGSPRKARKPGKPFDKSKIICYNSDEAGHFKRDCPKLKGQKKKVKSRKHHAHATNEGAEQYVAGKQLKHFGQLGSIRGVVCY